MGSGRLMQGTITWPSALGGSGGAIRKFDIFSFTRLIWYRRRWIVPSHHQNERKISRVHVRTALFSLFYFYLFRSSSSSSSVEGLFKTCGGGCKQCAHSGRRRERVKWKECQECPVYNNRSWTGGRGGGGGGTLNLTPRIEWEMMCWQM